MGLVSADTDKVFYRIVGIYVLSTLVIGLTVSQNSPDLLEAVAAGGKTAASSPFVVMCKQAGVKVLPSIINGVVMTSALSAGNEMLYACSRTYMALAQQGMLICNSTDNRRHAKDLSPYQQVWNSHLGRRRIGRVRPTRLSQRVCRVQSGVYLAEQYLRIELALFLAGNLYLLCQISWCPQCPRWVAARLC